MPSSSSVINYNPPIHCYTCKPSVVAYIRANSSDTIPTRVAMTILKERSHVYVLTKNNPDGYSLCIDSTTTKNQQVYIKNGDLSVDPVGSSTNTAETPTANYNGTYTTNSTVTVEEPISDVQATLDTQMAIYKEWLDQEYLSTDVTENTDLDSELDSLSGIYGIPYQFTDLVDPRYTSSNSKNTSEFGQYYTERILNRMPLLMMSPGKVAFMSDFKSPEKLGVFERLVTQDDNTTISSVLKSEGKYYTFEYDTASYWEYVNGMARACATYLGIDNVKVQLGNKTTKLSAADWSNATNNSFDSLLISNESYVSFYVDGISSRNEDYSNSTQESSLAQKINGYSDTAKEARFLMGDVVAEQVDSLLGSNAVQAVQSQISSIADKYLNGSPIFKDLSKEFSVIASGGKLLFPEIYSDSDSSTQSIDVTIKLRCPNPDVLSWYLDIVIPIIHAIAFVLPKTPEGSVNGYSTPFLVRANCQGIFSCDMGIVTSLSIAKGKEGSWTLDRFPTEVDMSMSIKDLYNVMAMSNPNNSADFLENTCFINYLATMCGININKPDLLRSIELWGSLKGNQLKDTVTLKKWWSHQSENISNSLITKYQGIFKG